MAVIQAGNRPAPAGLRAGASRPRYLRAVPRPVLTRRRPGQGYSPIKKKALRRGGAARQLLIRLMHSRHEGRQKSIPGRTCNTLKKQTAGPAGHPWQRYKEGCCLKTVFKEGKKGSLDKEQRRTH